MSSTIVASESRDLAVDLARLLIDGEVAAGQSEAALAHRLTSPGAPFVVLFGAGRLGRRLNAALDTAGVAARIFADNDPGLWGTCLDGVPVLSPADAAARHRDRGLFVVTVWNPDHAFSETAGQLRALGCREVIGWIELARGLPTDLLLPRYAASRPLDVLSAVDDVMAAAALWADAASAAEYVRQVRFRLSGDFDDLGNPAPDQYFASDVVALRPGEAFVDCGAFDGDTIHDFVTRCPRFGSVDAFEPDAANYELLERSVATLGAAVRGRIRLHRAATDRETATRDLVGDSAASALLGATGDDDRTRRREGDAGEPDGVRRRVPCVPLDDALADVPVSFVKMDVEGAEAGTLCGAQRLLCERRPVVAASAYHRSADLWQLPALLASLTDGYCLHLRAHRPDGFDCVLYGVPAERHLP
jgi:FkbM family methyltransferase